MQTIKNYTHITQDLSFKLIEIKGKKTYRKPHLEQNHNLHYNKGKYSAFKKTRSNE